MSSHGYATVIGEKEACAVGRHLPISRKQSIEVAAYIRGRPLAWAKKHLEEVTEGERAIPFRRYTNGLGHKPGMAAGRFPQKTAAAILTVLESAEANARHKGLNTTSMSVRHIVVHTAQKVMRYGRQGKHRAKRSHVEVVLSEGQPAPAKKQKAAKPAEEKK